MLGAKNPVNSRNNAYASAIGILWLLLFCAFALVLPSRAAQAADGNYIVTETVETLEYETFEPAALSTQPSGQSSLVQSSQVPSSQAPSSHALLQYGPFSVVSEHVVQMSGTVDSSSPGLFRQMLRDYPGIKRIEMIDCSGSIDEEANLQLARYIRGAGINTHVPSHGSVRSGAVELFLSGVQHTADYGAEFVVHSWIDEDGREAKDVPMSDPVHAEYLDYYREMGIPDEKAQAFYALTNSVPYSEQLRLSRSDLASYQMVN